MKPDPGLYKFMVKFYEGMLYGMLRSRLTTDDRLTDDYTNLDEKEKGDLDKEMLERSREMARTVTDLIVQNNLLIETDPTVSQIKEIDEIIRKVLSDYSSE